jgi:hypothetical protein
MPVIGVSSKPGWEADGSVLVSALDGRSAEVANSQVPSSTVRLAGGAGRTVVTGICGGQQSAPRNPGPLRELGGFGGVLGFAHHRFLFVGGWVPVQ